MNETRPLELVTAVAEAIEGAHTEATLRARLAVALGSHARVSWGDDDVLAIELADPALDPTMGKALHALVRTGLSQVRTLARVATLSRRALADRETLRAELSRRAPPPSVVARSPAMRALFEDAIPRVAADDVSVLVRGETGSGKEVVLRRIHALSRRASRPLVVTNCGALPETLGESTLFGHERGAFTGAHARHVGLFERAHGGTLLLDEVGELTLAMQARLLRVIERGELERVGGTAVVRVDVRLLAATHRPLESMVAAGTFREDLLYRLAVVPLVVPPLRERAEDLAPLIETIVSELAERRDLAPPEISPAVLARLSRWPWPGNVRELRNVLERALVLGGGARLSLPADFDRHPPRAAEPETFDDAQRRVLLGALDAASGRIYGPTGAAARLGIPPTTLRSKLERLGIAAWRSA